MPQNLSRFIQSVVKGIGIATAGGGLALGAGQINLVNVDFFSIVAVVVFSVVFNTIYQWFNKMYVK